MGKVCGVNLAVCRAIWGLFGSRLTPLPLEETSAEKVCALMLSSTGSGWDQGVQMPAAGPAVLGTHSGHLLRGSCVRIVGEPQPLGALLGQPVAVLRPPELCASLCTPAHPGGHLACSQGLRYCPSPSALLRWPGRGPAAGSMLRAGVRRSCAKSEE